MYRRPHDEQDGMKMWLSASEVEQYLDHVEDTTRRIALGLAFRCGLRSAEVIEVAPADVVDGPAGTMLRVREQGAKGDQPRDAGPARPR
jgi:integrase